jgi:hypothetical protein
MVTTFWRHAFGMAAISALLLGAPGASAAPDPVSACAVLTSVPPASASCTFTCNPGDYVTVTVVGALTVDSTAHCGTVNIRCPGVTGECSRGGTTTTGTTGTCTMDQGYVTICSATPSPTQEPLALVCEVTRMLPLLFPGGDVVVAGMTIFDCPPFLL